MFFAEFIAEYIDSTRNIILCNIWSVKRSLQYDLEKKLRIVKLSHHGAPTTGGERQRSLREILEVTLPIDNVESFIAFDKFLQPEAQIEEIERRKGNSKAEGSSKILLLNYLHINVNINVTY